MHSFNYDEQTNQRLQQQILSGQDYVSESVTTDYNLDLDPESSVDTFGIKQNDNVQSDQQLTYPISGAEQSENNIEYGEVAQHQRNPIKWPTYFDKVADDNAISTRFYTVLPNREAAEKLAALAAAGNVNSHLIGQLRKQQKKDMRKDEAMPFNHKNDDGDVVIQHDKLTQSQTDQQQKYNQSTSHQDMKISQQHRRKQNDEKSPLQITVPDYETDYVTSDNDSNNVRKDDIGDIEYEYENEDETIEDVQSVTLFDGKTIHNNNASHIEFGSRLRFLEN